MEFSDAVPLIQLPPPPRKIRRKRGRGAVVGLVIVLTIPFGFGGWLIAWGLIAKFVGSQGQPITAFIRDKDVRTLSGRGGRIKVYFLHYSYNFAGATHSDEQQVTGMAYSLIDTGREITGKAMRVGPWTVCVLDLDRVNPQPILGLFFVVIFAGFVAMGWIPALKIQRLLRWGNAAAGEIIDRGVAPQGRVRHYIIYRFRPAIGMERVRKQTVSREIYTNSYPGTTLTIIYNPAKPQQNVPYEFCEYEFVSA